MGTKGSSASSYKGKILDSNTGDTEDDVPFVSSGSGMISSSSTKVEDEEEMAMCKSKGSSASSYKGKALDFETGNTDDDVLFVSSERAAAEKALAGESLAVEHIAELAPGQARNARRRAKSCANAAAAAASFSNIALTVKEL